MLYVNLFNLLILCLICSLCKANKYCGFTENHTMCKYKGIGERCKNPGYGGIKSDGIFYIVSVHNFLRRKVARGAETRGLKYRQPPAGNMMKIVWDSELQKIAQRWADQCIYENDERRVQRWEVGQNLFLSNKAKIIYNWGEALGTWMNEVQQFDATTISNYAFDFNTTRYTQMVWGNTYRVGCGMRSWEDKKIYVCNYGPAGNVPNTAMYEKGSPCSNCPNNTYCEYGLCVYPESFLRSDVIDTESPEAGKSKP